jgi:monoamine oxidase
MNRRQFLATTSSVLFLLAVHSCQPYETFNATLPKTSTIVILGAGMAGLSAATALKNMGYNNVTILEGRDRVGGRIHTVRSSGIPFEMGAAWIHGPGKGNPIPRLAKAAGSTFHTTDFESIRIWRQNGSPVSAREADAGWAQYERIRETLRRVEPEKSLENALRSHNPALLNDRLLLHFMSVEMEFDGGGPLDRLSAKRWDDDDAFPGDDVVLPLGYDRIPQLLAAGLDIRLKTVVTSVSLQHSGVTIGTNSGLTEADFCICTLPLGVLKSGNVGFEPSIPTSIQNAINTIEIGTVNKVALTFPSAFWDSSISFFGFCPEETGRFPYIMNVKKVIPAANQLILFALGRFAERMEQLTDAQITSEAMSVLRVVWGNAIPEPSEVQITRWKTDPMAMGAYSCMNIGARKEHFDAFTQPWNDRVFFAGEHTIHNRRSTVHGAWLSGERAARDLMRM